MQPLPGRGRFRRPCRIAAPSIHRLSLATIAALRGCPGRVSATAWRAVCRVIRTTSALKTRTADCRADHRVIDLAVASCEVSRLADHCSEDEIARANLFSSTTHRDRYLTCRGRVREVLAGYAGCSPGELRFTTTPLGKPYLPDYSDELYFNVSHSGDLAVLGVSRAYRIDFDLEKRGRQIVGSLFAKRAFRDPSSVPICGSSRLSCRSASGRRRSTRQCLFVRPLSRQYVG